jgi:hypothetical protein
MEDKVATQIKNGELNSIGWCDYEEVVRHAFEADDVELFQKALELYKKTPDTKFLESRLRHLYQSCEYHKDLYSKCLAGIAFQRGSIHCLEAIRAMFGAPEITNEDYAWAAWHGHFEMFIWANQYCARTPPSNDVVHNIVEDAGRHPVAGINLIHKLYPNLKFDGNGTRKALARGDIEYINWFITEALLCGHMSYKKGELYDGGFDPSALPMSGWQFNDVCWQDENVTDISTQIKMIEWMRSKPEWFTWDAKLALQGAVSGGCVPMAQYILEQVPVEKRAYLLTAYDCEHPINMEYGGMTDWLCQHFQGIINGNLNKLYRRSHGSSREMLRKHFPILQKDLTPELTPLERIMNIFPTHNVFQDVNAEAKLMTVERAEMERIEKMDHQSP